MASKVQYNPLTSQVTLIVLAIAAFSLAMVVGFGFFATLSTDRDSLEKQKAFVATGMADGMAALVRRQASVTVWDDTVIAARNDDQAWMAENIGEWLHSYYGFDRVYVLDAQGRSIHVMQDGKTVSSSAYEGDRATVEPYVAKLRGLMRDAPDAGDPPVVVSDLVSLGGAPAMLAVQPIVPSSDRVIQEPGAEYVHVSIRLVDDEVIDHIASQYRVSGMRLLPQLAEALPDASIPLMGSSGVILGYIAWDPDRPGTALIRQASPALIGFGLLAAGVLWYLLGRLRHATNILQRSRSQAEYLALHDTLTGLPNRALFEDRLRRALAVVSRDERRIGLLYIDLDRFKTVNDTFGHPCGDELVRQTARRLEASVRKVDTVARLGGDEFAVIVFDIKGPRTAEELCERLLGELGKPFGLMGNQVFIGASIGVALSHGPDTDPDELLRRADIALYEAKQKGGGRYETFADDMDHVIERKRAIESDLRAALSGAGGLRLCYQPVYSPDCRTVVGAEALVRWDHPVHGALPPEHFVSIAEERGMTNLFGDWVLSEVARFAATVDLPWIAFNVSPLQLRDAGFADHMLGILREAGVPPSRIQIEIVEGALLENSQATRAVLTQLRDAGVHIALDDFGTGYSSINYLQRHVIDKLKIDRSFVQMLGTTEGTGIVKAIVELAMALKVRVTAEGVETPEQRHLLVTMGCDELQGFLLSPALEAREIRELALLSASPLPSPAPEPRRSASGG